MTELRTAFGRRLQKLRRDKGLTQEQLANAIGLSVESISNVERGIYGLRFDNLEKAAEILDVEVNELFTFEE